MAGATGLVGRAVLDRLLADKRYAAVHCVGRRAPARLDPRLTVHLLDSFSEFISPPVDDVFISLGTTLKVAGSRPAFRALDLDAVVALARAGRAGRAAGATHLGVVSAMGADSRSPAFYNRIKGEMEAALGALGFETLVIARPSLLAGDRASLGQPARFAEKWALRVLALIQPLVPAHYRPVQADAVAGALVNRLRTAGPGRHVVLSGDLRLDAENL